MEGEYFLIPLQDRVMLPFVRSQIRLSPSDFGKLEDFLKDSGATQVVVASVTDRQIQTIGTLCRVIARDGGNTVHLEGSARVSITYPGGADKKFKVGARVKIKVIPDLACSPTDTQQIVSEISSKVNEFVRISAAASNKQTSIVVKFHTSSSPAAVANIVTAALFASQSISVAEAQQLLEQPDVSIRLAQVNTVLVKAIEAAKIRQEVNETIARKHTAEMRKHLIKRQIAELQAQLKSISGNADDDDDSSGGDDVSKLKKKFASLTLPDEVDKIVKKEFKRLDSIQSHHPEFPGILTYLETVAMLPWESVNISEINLEKAKTELDANHFSMEKVKKRVLEFLAVEKLTKNGGSTVLCLHGSPGVGKTSIAESIARSMDRKFIRISLSGVRDESELRGHRKTYIGAMAGLIIQSLIRAGTNCPVILLDEIDKVSSVGNPMARAGSGGAGSVLLELLDPEQNGAFRDAFLNFGFDLSKCFFICTCNSLSAVSRPLLDRLDIVTVEGYTDLEKIQIAQRHLIAKQEQLCGLTNIGLKLKIPDDVILFLISGYTHEAGVRSLSRRIGDLCRHFAMLHATRPGDQKPSVVELSVEQTRSILGPSIPEGPIIGPGKLPVGVSLGLAVSGAGGDVLFIETVITGGSSGATGQITVTGQLGDVMKESVRTALSLLMARALNRFSSSHETSVYRTIDPAKVRSSDVHVHFPTGSVQKDGPSAGVSTSIALASLFSGISPRSDLASTGEITLRGDVLPIGGVKQKLIAAQRAGIKTVLLPWANKASMEEVPQDVIRAVNVIFVKNIDEVMRVAFPQSESDVETIVLNKSSL
jgi:ATP-dependent Lon protease